MEQRSQVERDIAWVEAHVAGEVGAGGDEIAVRERHERGTLVVPEVGSTTARLSGPTVLAIRLGEETPMTGKEIIEVSRIGSLYPHHGAPGSRRVQSSSGGDRQARTQPFSERFQFRCRRIGLRATATAALANAEEECRCDRIVGHQQSSPDPAGRLQEIAAPAKLTPSQQRAPHR